jgi:hypothetical protein
VYWLYVKRYIGQDRPDTPIGDGDGMIGQLAILGIDGQDSLGMDEQFGVHRAVFWYLGSNDGQ